jgi:hypothetical protein
MFSNNINQSSLAEINATQISKEDFFKLTQDFKNAECGPNIGSIMYIVGNSVHNKLFWSIIIYNSIFVITPVIGNLILSAYLLKKRSLLKIKLDRVINYKTHIRKLDLNAKGSTRDVCLKNLKRNMASIDEINKFYRPKNAELSDYHVEFLRTVTPCISFSLTHVILFLPYSIIDTLNQITPSMSFMAVLQYMTYVRYIFYCCKFYLLILVSYKFRKEFRESFSFNNKSAQNLESLN